MNDNNKVGDTVALVLAAGSGSRLGMGPKAFVQLGGCTLLRRVVQVLSGCVDRVLVGVPPEHIGRAKEEVKGAAEVIAGAATRKDTILRLLEHSTEDIVLVHDVARPFITRELTMQVLAAAQECGAAVACDPQSVHLLEVKDGYVNRVLPRHKGMLGQTPDVCRRPILDKAVDFARDNKIEDLVFYYVLAKQGIPTRAIPISSPNIKITTPLDWEIATRVIAPHLFGGQEQ